MKRLILLALSVCVISLLAACSSEGAESSSDSESSTISTTDSQPETETKTEETDTDTSEENDNETADSVNTSSGSNILVAWFSCTGTTEQIAQWVIGETGADSYEIVPEDPYTEEDLAYYTGGRADQEQADSTVRPAICGSVENIEQYDVIFLGYPIWHGQAPRIISTFLESYDLSDVTIIPFCTSHSSGIGSSAENLHSLCADTVTWMDGRRFSGDATESDVVEWVESLELPESEVRTVGEFDFETKTVLLNSGYEMPIMGLGTYSLTDEECAVSIAALLEAGGRLIDTAYMYGNEAAVGQAIRDSDVPREEIFVITKLYPSQFDHAAEAIDEALEKMGLDYIDMILLHHPGDGDVEAYLALEQAVADGKVHSIGLSNWYVEELEEFLPQVILRWDLQKGVVVIPGSSDPDHIRENLDLFGFELTDEEMEQINDLDRNKKHDWY